MRGVLRLMRKPPGYYFAKLEEAYVAIFEISAWLRFEASTRTEEEEKRRDARLARSVAKAYISSVLEQLSIRVYKETGLEEDIWVFLSFPALEQRLRGAYKMRALKDAMKELIEDGYVFKRPNRDPRFRALEYRMNFEQYCRELSALPTKDTAKRGANLHDDGAKPQSDGANLHDDEGKNARFHRADSHPRINRVESTERFNFEQQRENDIADAATAGEYSSASADEALALLASLFHLSTEETRKVLQFALELQQKPLRETYEVENPAPSTPSTSEALLASRGTESEASGQKEFEQARGKVASRGARTRTNNGEPQEPSAEALAVLAAWDCVSGMKMPRIRSNLEAAEELARIGATADELKNVRDRLLAQRDRGQAVSFWESRGVRLKDVLEHYHLASLSPLLAKGPRGSDDQQGNVSSSSKSVAPAVLPTGSGGQKRKPLRLISDAAPKPKEARAGIA